MLYTQNLTKCYKIKIEKRTILHHVLELHSKLMVFLYLLECLLVNVKKSQELKNPTQNGAFYG